MFELSSIISGILGGLIGVTISEKMNRKGRAVPLQNAKHTFPPPIGRFVFSEETVREKMGKIVERFKLGIQYRPNRPYTTDCYLFGKSNFSIYISGSLIRISATSLIVCEPLDLSEPLSRKKYYKYYTFCFTDSSTSGKSGVYVEYEFGHENIFFYSDISFNDLSDDEIFGIIEKIIYALYGAVSMEYDTVTSEDGKKSIIFYLDAPDYYGYTETTEIGNFKFILNKENGGTVNV